MDTVSQIVQTSKVQILFQLLFGLLFVLFDFCEKPGSEFAKPILQLVLTGMMTAVIMFVDCWIVNCPALISKSALTIQSGFIAMLAGGAYHHVMIWDDPNETYKTMELSDSWRIP
jgi:hypothetical protein